MSAGLEALLERLAPEAARDGGDRAARGRAWLVQHGLPRSRDEAWRYTPLDDVQRVLEVATPAPERSDDVTRSLVDELAGDLGGPRIVCVNGALVPPLCTLEPRAGGLWLGGVGGLRPRPRPGHAAFDQPVDGFHALNWAAGRDVAAVVVDAGAELDEPVHVVHVSTSAGGVAASHPRTVVRTHAGSRVHVVESFVALSGPSLTNASTRLVLADDAALTYHRLHVAAPGSVHIGRTGARQAAGSRLRATSVVAGGEIVRNAIDVGLAGVDARAELEGLSVVRGNERHDTVVTVDHGASRTTSAQRYRGIVDDHGRGSFSGHVIVRPDTQGADASQSSRNLVLSSTAQADTRPWLEIFADEVRCTHGATVGRLDDDALFYLRSRGIPLDRARAMLVAAFAAEVVDGIRPAALHDRVAAALAQRGLGASS